MKSMRDIMRSYAVFDASGRHVNGSDKESNHHFGDAYESLFSDRSAVRLMMEIGVATGESIRAWRDIFPCALCVGMDIHPSTWAHGDRIRFCLGDQRSKEDCERAAEGGSFDLIVDDASHQPADVLVSMLWLWPYVAQGGLYVVEDWPTYLLDYLTGLFPAAQLVDTIGPTGGYEPIIVFRKPL